MPLQETSGAASYDAFGGGVAAVPQYIEDVFSTYLYTGNGATGQSIVNGIDLSTKGGLVWLKSRTTPSGSSDNNLYDTVRGASQLLISNSTNAQTTATRLSFQTTGFNLTNEASSTNESGVGYVSWTFRKQPKFFDIQTWTGTGSNRTISHSLGSVPACIMVKRTDSTGDWQVYHRSLANTEYLVLNTTAAKATGATRWNSTTPTSTVFSVGTDATVNASGGTYVAYIFAHDAGGFGLTGTNNVISCGSFTGTGIISTNLGYEPQWIIVKNTTSVDTWWMFDTMRGWSVAGDLRSLNPNTSSAESGLGSGGITPTATGFNFDEGLFGSGTWIYIAIRRGPMKVPTSGTRVFTPVARSGTGSTSTVSNSITTDLIISMTRNTAGIDSGVWDRLRGITKYLATTGTATESTSSDSVTALNNTSYVLGADTATDRINRSGYTYANWTFSRAPSFFDEVCYTGDGGSNRALSHNLQVVPELVIYKRRSGIADWLVWTTSQTGKGALLNTTDAFFTNANTAGTSTWTSSTIYIKNAGFDGTSTNGSGSTYVAYLFATCAGVSKVGSYTGTGALQTVNCGFTSGARFVLIKRTDSTGDWWTYDSARGITSGNDPYLFLNSTAAEVTGTNYVDTDSTGFKVTAAAPAGLNASGGTYIFLAIA